MCGYSLSHPIIPCIGEGLFVFVVKNANAVFGGACGVSNAYQSPSFRSGEFMSKSGDYGFVSANVWNKEGTDYKCSGAFSFAG